MEEWFGVDWNFFLFTPPSVYCTCLQPSHLVASPEFHFPIWGFASEIGVICSEVNLRYFHNKHCLSCLTGLYIVL